MHQNDLENEKKARALYLEQNLHIKTQFVTKPLLEGKKLSGKAKIGNKVYHYYFNLNKATKRYNYKVLYQQTCNVNGILKPLNQSPYSKISFFITAIDVKSCHAYKPNYITVIERHKSYIFDRLSQTKIIHPAKIVALISGDTSGISNDDLNKYKDIGIYHLLAVSGTHIATIIGILMFVLNIFKLPLICIKVSLLINLPIYALYTDLAPSAVRAILAALIIILIPKFVINNVMNVLALLFIVLTTINPAYLYDVGFQFSFLITFFILFSSPILERASPIKSLLFITIIAQLGSFMISAIYFNQIQWIGVFSNLFFVPFYTFILFPLVILFFIMSHIPFELLPLTSLLNLILRLHDNIVELFLFIDTYKWYVPKLNNWFITLGFTILFISLLLLVHKRYAWFICSLVVLYMAVSILPLSNDYKLTMLNVNQGDSILFETNKQNNVLIDTGGKLVGKGEVNSHNISKYHILPTFKKHGLKKINYLIITHPHIDHMGELDYLINTYPIDNIIINKKSYQAKDLNSLYNKCINHNINLFDFRELKSISLDKANINLIDVTIAGSEDLNEQSIITLIEYGGFKLLLMGDATVNNETLLIDKYHIDRINVLKVVHHGSKTSSSINFLDAIHPEISLISVGDNNRYKLPNKEIIERLKQINSRILQTNKHGEISIILNPHKGLKVHVNQ